MASTIYSVSYCIKKNIFLIQLKRKGNKERTKTQASKTFILACQKLRLCLVTVFVFYFQKLIFKIIKKNKKNKKKIKNNNNNNNNNYFLVFLKSKTCVVN